VNGNYKFTIQLLLLGDVGESSSTTDSEKNEKVGGLVIAVSHHNLTTKEGSGECYRFEKAISIFFSS